MRLIGIAGPSCSGKSTLAKELAKEYDMAVLGMDSYFKDHTEWHDHWETPESMYLNDMLIDLCSIKKGQTTTVPVYRRRHMQRTGTKELQPKQDNIIEGFLLFTDERIRELLDIRIYIDITPEEQLRRRRERQPELKEEYFWEKIIKEYNKHGLPSRRYADHIIDGHQTPEHVLEQARRILNHDCNIYFRHR